MAYVKFQREKVKVDVACDRFLERMGVGEICIKIPHRTPFLYKLI